MLSKTQIDRLGDRLRADNITEQDLRTLDDYRKSFTEAYEVVVRTIREQLKIETTGRPAKSTTSLAEKLNRESIRLTQVQDIAGCRIVVPDLSDQDLTVTSLQKIFPLTIVVDRRDKPSHGYRAIHIIVKTFGHSIETQVRTSPQHLWAEISEKVSDVVDREIKYGGGPTFIKEMLLLFAELIAAMEQTKEELKNNLARIEVYAEIKSERRHMERLRKESLALQNKLDDVIAQGLARFSKRGQTT